MLPFEPNTRFHLPPNLNFADGPFLAGEGETNLSLVRPLTTEEKTALAGHRQKYFTALDRFQLRKIMGQNFIEWKTFVKELQDPGLRHRGELMLQANRLLSNYFSAAKAWIDHFTRHYVRTFRKTEAVDALKVFLDQLGRTKREFALFEDLRNFTQHSGLPITSLSIHAGQDSKAVTIHAQPERLVAMTGGDPRNWEKSNLKADDPSIDMVALLPEINRILHFDIGGFLASVFGPDLIATHDFYVTLNQAVQEAAPGTKIAFVEFAQSTTNPKAFQIMIWHPTSDVFGDLGISVTQAPDGVNVTVASAEGSDLGESSTVKPPAANSDESVRPAGFPTPSDGGPPTA